MNASPTTLAVQSTIENIENNEDIGRWRFPPFRIERNELDSQDGDSILF
jgi:hypothetical protein